MYMYFSFSVVVDDLHVHVHVQVIRTTHTHKWKPDFTITQCMITCIATGLCMMPLCTSHRQMPVKGNHSYVQLQLHVACHCYIVHVPCLTSAASSYKNICGALSTSAMIRIIVICKRGPFDFRYCNLKQSGVQNRCHVCVRFVVNIVIVIVVVLLLLLLLLLLFTGWLCCDVAS